jgi:hypothetical protein
LLYICSEQKQRNHDKNDHYQNSNRSSIHYHNGSYYSKYDIMKKILYLHGLESKQGGTKVDFMSSNNLVHAPSLDYKNEETYNSLLSIIQEIDFDLIVGSSMGGFMAMHLSTLVNVQTILFNPSLTPTKDKIYGGHHFYKNGDVISPNPIVAVGRYDKVINPFELKEYFVNQLKIKHFFMLNIGHKVDLIHFKDIYNKYENEEINNPFS